MQAMMEGVYSSSSGAQEIASEATPAISGSVYEEESSSGASTSSVSASAQREPSISEKVSSSGAQVEPTVQGQDLPIASASSVESEKSEDINIDDVFRSSSSASMVDKDTLSRICDML